MKLRSYEVEERAAIYEYDAHMTREQAEARAFGEAINGDNLEVLKEITKPYIAPPAQQELF